MGQPARVPECNFCECFSHAWAPTQRWGVILVDADDAHLLSVVWTLTARVSQSFYAASRSRLLRRGRLQKTCLHQAVFPDQQLLDHKNRNGLDCRKTNLRDATHQQNSQNRPSHMGSSSTYKGVYWNKNERKWRASIFVGKVSLNLGYFHLEEDAALAYNFAAHEHYGEFARFNQAARVR